MGGKKARKKLSKNTRIGYPKFIGKKSSGQRVKIRFYKHMNIVMKNRGEKTREKFFKKHTNRVYKNCWKKNVSKKCEKFF